MRDFERAERERGRALIEQMKPIIPRDCPDAAARLARIGEQLVKVRRLQEESRAKTRALWLMYARACKDHGVEPATGAEAP